MSIYNQTQHHEQTVLEEQETRLTPPPFYKVLMLNDDYTPMEFVVSVLKMFFGMSEGQANQIMLNIHNNGFGICGVYTKDIAETKVMQVFNLAQAQGHPLQCRIEKVE